MNTAAELVMTDIATVWAVTGTNDFGQREYGLPYTIVCNYREGGKITKGRDGNDFVPSATYRTFDERPQVGDFIAQGDYSNSQETPDSISGANEIVQRPTKTPFLDWRQRYNLLTN